MDSEKIELVVDSGNATFKESATFYYDGENNNDKNDIYLYWLFLAGAILTEVMGTSCMKLSEGLTNFLPSIAIFLFYACSFTLLPLSLKRIQLSTAYAIWSGVGTTLTCLIGIIHFGDTTNWVKIIAIAFIVVGCVMLQAADSLLRKDQLDP